MGARGQILPKKRSDRFKVSQSHLGSQSAGRQWGPLEGRSLHTRPFRATPIRAANKVAKTSHIRPVMTFSPSFTATVDPPMSSLELANLVLLSCLVLGRARQRAQLRLDRQSARCALSTGWKQSPTEHRAARQRVHARDPKTKMDRFFLARNGCRDCGCLKAMTRLIGRAISAS